MQQSYEHLTQCGLLGRTSLYPPSGRPPVLALSHASRSLLTRRDISLVLRIFIIIESAEHYRPLGHRTSCTSLLLHYVEGSERRRTHDSAQQFSIQHIIPIRRQRLYKVGDCILL